MLNSHRRYHLLHLNVLFFCLLSLGVTALTKAVTPCNDTGPVVPTTPLVTFLERVQETALLTLGENKDFDQKTYVDLSLKNSLLVTEQAFDRLPKSENGSVSANFLEEFTSTYFEAAGTDLVYHEPQDFVPEPEGFLPKVKNPVVRAWALEVHSLWKNLSRNVSVRVNEQPELHTLLPLPEMMIVPGSRFRELYYWDSYWVIRGLLAGKMYKSAKAIVSNLIALADTYGYVLNGARAYYTNRSQPPLLSAMVYEIFTRTGDVELARNALPVLLKEHKFWNSGQHKVTIQSDNGKEHSLSRYHAMWDKPRPESSTIDKKFASKFIGVDDRKHFYRELASGAESGWDFSSRWMRNSSEFTTLATTSVLPVDLNVYMLRMELDIAFLAEVTGEESTKTGFLEAAQARKEAINSVFWNAKKGQWFDYWLPSGTACEESQLWQASNQNQNAFAANFVPLWLDLFNSDKALVEHVVESLRSSGLICTAGIATSATKSGEQWDFPNGWAPIQHMIVEGLVRSASEEARSLAEDIAVKWIRSNYAGYKKTGVIHEKYDVTNCGESGGGGEYASQTGFGWSNGVVLAFLEEFGWREDLSIDCSPDGNRRMDMMV